MKNFIMMMISAILGVLTLMIVMAIDGRSNRSMELQSNLPSAVEETVEIMAANKKYNIDNPNEYLADFMESLSSTLDSDSGIKVEIINTDKERGLLSILVTEEFEHPNGKIGTVECERTVILNKLDVPEPETYTVRFYMTSGELYKSCSVYEGDMILAPVNPTSENGTFAGWTDLNGYLADFSVPVTQNLDYYAVWN